MASIHLTPAERQDLLDRYRRSAEPDVRLRAHILLLLDAGHPWVTIKDGQWQPLPRPIHPALAPVAAAAAPRRTWHHGNVQS